MTQMETISTLPRIGMNIWRVGGREGAETERHREAGSQREMGKERQARRGVETDKRLIGLECVCALNTGWHYYWFL